MKTFITEFRSYFKTFALASLMLGMTVFNAACGSSGSGATNPNAIYGNYNGFGGMSTTSQAVGDWGQYPDIEMILSFAQTGGYGVSAAGYLVVQAQTCGLMPGTYQIQATQAASVSGNQIYGLSLTGYGSYGQVQVYIGQATIDSAGGPTRALNGQYYPLRITSYGQTAIGGQYGSSCNGMNFY